VNNCPAVSGWHHPDPLVVEGDQQEEGQQADAAQVEGHGDGLLRAALEQVGRDVEAGEGGGQHEETAA